MSRFTLAINDIKRATLQYQLWWHLGEVEIKQRYRRSVLGPWWITISMMIFISAMGIVFSRLFHQEIKQYIPYFTAGFLFWTFLSTSITEASEIFRSNGGFIKQINLPHSLYVYKHLTRQIICLLHNSVVYLIACVAFQLNPGPLLLMIIPGFILFLINIYWISFLVAMICTRYRDMVPIINSCVQIAFFITPISWTSNLLGQTSLILKLNPLVYLLDIVRSPFLGTMPATISWIVTMALALTGCLCTFLLFSRTRSRIAFWVN